MDEKQEWHLFDDEEKTTLAVPKSFATKLREEYKGSNDLGRLFNWAKEEFEYKDSITNEDLLEAIQDRETDYNNSISIDDIQNLVESQLSRLTIDKRSGDVMLE